MDERQKRKELLNHQLHLIQKGLGFNEGGISQKAINRLHAKQKDIKSELDMMEFRQIDREGGWL